MSVRILCFDAIHTVIKKMFHKGPVAANGILYTTKLGTSVDGHDKIIT
jgi:hypothetical protein